MRGADARPPAAADRLPGRLRRRRRDVSLLDALHGDQHQLDFLLDRERADAGAPDVEPYRTRLHILRPAVERGCRTGPRARRVGSHSTFASGPAEGDPKYGHASVFVAVLGRGLEADLPRLVPGRGRGGGPRRPGARDARHEDGSRRPQLRASRCPAHRGRTPGERTNSRCSTRPTRRRSAREFGSGMGRVSRTWWTRRLGASPPGREERWM